MQWPCCQAIYFPRLQRSIPLQCQWWWIVSPRDQRSLPLCRLFRLQTCHKELWVCSLYLFASLRLLSKSLWCTLHKLITNTTWNSLKGQICRRFSNWSEVWLVEGESSNSSQQKCWMLTSDIHRFAQIVFNFFYIISDNSLTWITKSWRSSEYSMIQYKPCKVDTYIHQPK